MAHATCPSCGRKVNVPQTAGLVHLRCPDCDSSFAWYSDPADRDGRRPLPPSRRAEPAAPDACDTSAAPPDA